ncbi:MAG: sulfotransferase, partial [Candidatus Kaiserbacteria bacterium]|nr:sulfotransferase [Candidatus Kaiserbacteria bacterium]
MINFIGLGAQKSGTSWAYTCLYEHPEVCIPVKEIHFFSRPRYAEGKEWYEAHFKKCAEGKLRGEWSTSYL